ncbi:MAG TPA: sigma-70 family RNA polymerase sigma factor [Planctomycetota bacterium]|jgi:RNA polymerase sigma-70 factor (ECF subfamily)|nr:sigma-70 family RNA polymerase sigma factor [Planctomycetota bacterium]
MDTRREFGLRIEQHIGLLRSYVHAKAGRVVKSREPLSDLVQSVVREACAARSPELDDDASFRSWLCTIAAHKIISKNRYYAAERRDASRETTGPDGANEIPGREDASPSVLAERGEELDRLRRALDELDPVDREILILRRIFDVPTAEIASRTSLAPSTVRGRLARVMTELACRLA